MAYSFYRSITFDATKVPSTLTNFPALVSLTNDSFKTTGNGGKVENASGFDIIFSSSNNLDGSDIIPFEIEKYVATTGEIAMWVNIASLDGTTDTVIYILYGNSAIVSSQEDIANTWDIDYTGIFHLKDNGSGGVSLVDSSVSAKNLVLVTGSAAALATGQIAGGADYSNNYYNNGTSFGTVVFPITFEAWIKSDALQLSGYFGHTQGGNDGVYCYINNDTSNNYPGYVVSNVAVYDNTGLTFTNDVWTYVVIRIDAAGTTAKAFKGTGGTLSTNSQAVSNAFQGTPNQLAVAARDGAPIIPFNGKLDELKYSKIARSDDWITTTYNNQYDPATFHTLGSEISSVLTVSVSDTLVLSDALALEAGIVLSFSDTLALTDEESVDGPDPAIVASDTLSLTDAVSIVATILLELSDTLSLTDDIALINALRIEQSDSLVLSDAISNESNITRSVGDILLLLDEYSLMLGLFLNISDSLVLSDSVQVAVIQEISVSDTLALLDAVSIQLNNTILGLTFSDTLVLSDAVSLQLQNASIPIINNLPYYRRYLNDVQ